MSSSGPTHYVVEDFTGEERALLARHVTSVDGPVFALVGLPQVTCAALFARYSRSAKSLRRLLVDEFAGELSAASAPAASGLGGLGVERARDLFSRVLAEYGDDSVAQLAGMHLACEQVSQPLAKAIEWGRLAAYLEQSTRYVAYTDRRSGRYRYHLDPAVEADRALAPVYHGAMDGLFDAYAACLGPVRAHLEATLPGEPDARARIRAIRALALDVCRALLPAGTVSNVGVFASAQALEQLVMRLRAHPLPEANAYAELIASELRGVIPEFLTRLDRSDRGGVWVDYLRETRLALEAEASALSSASAAPAPAGVTLTRWDPDGEVLVAAAALLPHTGVPEREILARVRVMPAEDLSRVLRAAVGRRGNRRHRPGRAFEHTEYTFEVVSDYGAFRDLQRHRLLTLEWQELSPALGADVPQEVENAGVGDLWRAAVARAEAAHDRIAEDLPRQAQYLVTLGHRLRYRLRLNAREAMHVIELRTSPQGHPSYRRVCLEMHRQIRDVAGHRLIAAAMEFVGSEDVHLPRYATEASRGG